MMRGPMLGGEANELIVTTPHEAASEVAFRAGAMTARTGNRILGIIENMAYLQCPHCDGSIAFLGQHGGNRLKDALQSEIWVRLPFEINQSRTDGPGMYAADSETGKSIRIVAARIERLLQEN